MKKLFKCLREALQVSQTFNLVKANIWILILNSTSTVSGGELCSESDCNRLYLVALNLIWIIHYGFRKLQISNRFSKIQHSFIQIWTLHLVLECILNVTEHFRQVQIYCPAFMNTCKSDKMDTERLLSYFIIWRILERFRRFRIFQSISDSESFWISVLKNSVVFSSVSDSNKFDFVFI